MEELALVYDRVLDVEQQTASARATAQEALVNLLQSRTELSTSGAMLSAATRMQMGKRGIAQLESVKGMLDLAADAATVVRGDADVLRREVQAALETRDEAVRAARWAETTQSESCAQMQASTAVEVLTIKEVAARAEHAAEQALSRAEAAELRAEVAERNFSEAELARSSGASAVAGALSARAAAEERLGSVEAQLAREREVLARVMSENVLFVKKVELAEAERARAADDLAVLRSAWRTQMETWFQTAADEMQGTLLADWGAAAGVQVCLCVCPGSLPCTSSLDLPCEALVPLCAAGRTCRGEGGTHAAAGGARGGEEAAE